MQILVIDSSEERKSTYEMVLEKIGFPKFHNPLIFANDFTDAKTIIQNDLETRQNPLDCIIAADFPDSRCCDWESRLSLISWLRTRPGEFSGNAFRISSIPLLIYGDYFDQTEIWEYRGYSSLDFITRNSGGHHYFLKQTLEGTIRNWRRMVYGDIDNLNISLMSLPFFKSGPLFQDYSEKIKSDFGYYFGITNTLSSTFIHNPKWLQYPWFNVGYLKQVEDGYYRFLENYNLMEENVIASKAGKPEIQIVHRFSKNHPIILNYGSFKDLVPSLSVPNTEYNEKQAVDFALKPYFYSRHPTRLVEFKTPREKIVVRAEGGHPSLAGDVNYYIGQVNDYLTGARSNPGFVQSKLGYIPVAFNSTLICGTFCEIDTEREKKIKQRRLAERPTEIDFITFNEHFERFVLWCEAIQRLID